MAAPSSPLLFSLLLHPNPTPLTVAALERALDLTAAFLTSDRSAFVVGAFAFCQRQFDFRDSVFEVDFHRHQRISLFAHPPPEPLNLPAMHQQLAITRFLMAELA